MNKLLHIIASPRQEKSRTLKVSNVFLERFLSKHPNCKVDELNVFTEPLPAITTDNVAGKYILMGGKDLSGEIKDTWKDLEMYIKRFSSPDAYLVSTPMWNFNIPYKLKHFIDIVVQPRYTFHYVNGSAEGLIRNKKMLIITSRGGEYGEGSPTHDKDFQLPYLRAIFGFVGITNIQTVIAEPMDAGGQEVREQRIKAAQEQASRIADTF